MPISIESAIKLSEGELSHLSIVKSSNYGFFPAVTSDEVNGGMKNVYIPASEIDIQDIYDAVVDNSAEFKSAYEDSNCATIFVRSSFILSSNITASSKKRVYGLPINIESDKIILDIYGSMFYNDISINGNIVINGNVVNKLKIRRLIGNGFSISSTLQSTESNVIYEVLENGSVNSSSSLMIIQGYWDNTLYSISQKLNAVTNTWIGGGENCRVIEDPIYYGGLVPMAVYHVNSYMSRTRAGNRLYWGTEPESTEFNEVLAIHMFDNDINTLDAANSLIPGDKYARAFPMSAEENIIIKIATVTDADEDNKWHIDFRIHFEIAQTTLSFMQDQFNEQNHFRFTYENESCNESWVYNQDTGAPGLIRIVKTNPSEKVYSYYLVAYHGYSSEAEKIEIIDGHITGTVMSTGATFNTDAKALLSSIIPLDNYYLTHKVRRDKTMSGTGSYYDPFSAKPTLVSSNDGSVSINTSVIDGVATHDLSVAGGQVDTYKVLCGADDALPGYFGDKVVGSDWISREDITESDIKKIQFALKNPEFFVKGNTIYGGIISDNFDIIGHTGFFTGYYNSIGAPTAQVGNPSWFVLHMNSNAGVVSAMQVAYAYVNTSIICYERVKLASTWGAWILRSSGGSSLNEISHISSMDGGGASDIIALQAGSSTQWSAHGIMTAPFGQITPIANQSNIGFLATQISTGNFISAIYKEENSGIHSLICESAVTALPANPSWTSAVVSSVENGLFIPANERVYMVIFTDANGVSLAGKSSTNFNLQPYVAGIKTNMGVLAAAPKKLQWESETNTRPFIYMTK